MDNVSVSPNHTTLKYLDLDIRKFQMWQKFSTNISLDITMP